MPQSSLLGHTIELWAKASTSVRRRCEQAERLAAYRQVALSGLDMDG